MGDEERAGADANTIAPMFMSSSGSPGKVAVAGG